MEEEIKRLTVTWVTAVLSLAYCHSIGKIIPKGTTRLVAILPVITLFFYLPLNLSTLCLGGPTSFFLTWLANFKLLLFSFGQGPLSSFNDQPTLSLPHFISIATLPIIIEPETSLNESKPGTHLVYVVKILLVGTYTLVYDLREEIPSTALFILYSVHLYLALELFLELFSNVAGLLFRVRLEPTFNKPYLATSLQDFWGRRWNLIVTGILRPTVYRPVKSLFSGRKGAVFPAVLAVFVVSGLMHELIFYYIGRKRPTLRLSLFFLVHGVAVLAEIAVKKWVDGRSVLPAAVSRALTATFVVATAALWFVPEMVRCEADVKARQEISAIVDFVRGIIGGRLISLTFN